MKKESGFFGPVIKLLRDELTVLNLKRKTGIRNLPQGNSFGQDSLYRLSSAYFPRNKIQQEKIPSQNEPLPSSS